MRGLTLQRGLAACVCAAWVVLGSLGLPASASAAPGPSLRTLDYHGYRLTVPRSWPVFDLSKHPSVCARFNRHALYLGAPGAHEQCPAQAVGRTEAILVQAVPLSRGEKGLARGVRVPAAISSGANSSGWIESPQHRVLITATWVSHPGLVTRALGLRSLQAFRHPAGVLPPGIAQATPNQAIAASVSSDGAASPGSVFTGAGFDACATPSSATMAAWHSAYGAVGIYIGGVNEASCAGRGLTSGWVRRQSSAGWHLIPIYVGRQAPVNDCGCQGIGGAHAASQGRFAARDAVAQAKTFGLGEGNPLYYDMENYPRSESNTSAVLAFLAGWTAELHARGYLSGVYAAGNSGVPDLVSLVGTGYTEPDALWIASWNSEDNTVDPNVPPSDWPIHERLHQDDGGHDESHGGVTINIDGDFVDGPTASAGTAAGAAASPWPEAPPTVSGAPVPGQTLTLWHASWSGTPTSYTEQWEDCDSSGMNCVAIPGATAQEYRVTASDSGYAIRVLETASNAYGEGSPVASVATSQVLSNVPLYWIRNASGHVYPSAGTPFYGSPFGQGFRGSTIVGAAATSSGQGYWLVSSRGKVFHFGAAGVWPTPRHANRIAGIVAAPGGGYWLFTAHGNVYASQGTPTYGSPSQSGFRGSTIVGMAASPDGQGYWLVNSAGTVFPFGDAAVLPSVPHSHRVIGIVAAPSGGYWLYTRHGKVYASQGAKWYGSPYRSGFRGSSITGLVASPEGDGYWAVDSSGNVYAFGDAPQVSALGHPNSVTGIFR